MFHCPFPVFIALNHHWIGYFLPPICTSATGTYSGIKRTGLLPTGKTRRLTTPGSSTFGGQPWTRRIWFTSSAIWHSSKAKTSGICRKNFPDANISYPATMTALGQSLFELFPDHGTDTRPDGSSKYVFPADRQHGAESVPLSATDLEPQASRLMQHDRALPRQAGRVQPSVARPEVRRGNRRWAVPSMRRIYQCRGHVWSGDGENERRTFRPTCPAGLFARIQIEIKG